MAEPRLDGLPDELLLEIVKHVENDVASLVALSLLNRHIQTIVDWQLFRRITLRVKGEKHFIKDVDEFPPRIGRNTRVLVVEGMIVGDNTPRTRPQTTQQRPQHFRPPSYKPNNTDVRPDYFYRPDVLRWHKLVMSAPMRMSNLYETDWETAWRPLSILVEKLPLLTDLHFSSMHQLAPSIIATLHQHRPSCRLHMKTFQFRSLKMAAPVPFPHEVALSTSPCLHSVSIGLPKPVLGRNLEARCSEQVLLSMISGRAPNLKSVHVFFYQPRLVGAHTGGAPTPWPGFEYGDSHSVGSLNELVLDHDHLQTLRWLEATDLSGLQVLEINMAIKLDALQYLAAEPRFRSLRRLSLHISKFPESQQYYDALKRVLFSLPLSVESVKLSGNIPQDIFYGMLQHCGHHIRVLYIGPLYGVVWEPPMVYAPGSESSDPFIQLVKGFCPHLDDLAMHLDEPEDLAGRFIRLCEPWRPWRS